MSFKKSSRKLFFPTWISEILRRWGVSFELLKRVSTSLCALVWRAANALVHVQNCNTDLFHTAWFGKKRFLLQPSSAPSMGPWEFARSAKTERVLSWRQNNGMREMRDNRTDQMDDPGPLLNFSPQGHRVAKIIMVSCAARRPRDGSQLGCEQRWQIRTCCSAPPFPVKYY